MVVWFEGQKEQQAEGRLGTLHRGWVFLFHLIDAEKWFKSKRQTGAYPKGPTRNGLRLE
jgi:hypothetical protein